MTDADILSHIRAAVMEETSAPAASIVPEASAQSVPGWDSLAHTRIIMNLEGRLDTVIDLDATYEAATVQDLIAVVQKALRPC